MSKYKHTPQSVGAWIPGGKERGGRGKDLTALSDIVEAWHFCFGVQQVSKSSSRRKNRQYRHSLNGEALRGVRSDLRSRPSSPSPCNKAHCQHA